MIDALHYLFQKLIPSLPEASETTAYRELHPEEGLGNRLLVHNAISEQIWREQQLVSNRMQWNFTFQGFLAAIFVFAGSNLDGWQVTSVQIVLGLVGILVAWFCLKGVVAAQAQSSRLKTHWVNGFCRSPLKNPGECNILRGAFPHPFSTTEGSRQGRFASRNVCGILMFMWGVMILIALFGLAFPRNSVSSKFSCTISGATRMLGDVVISCKSK